MSSTPPLPQDTPEMEAEAETEATLTSNESLQTDMPMTMAASVVLDHLPRDAHDALSKAGMLEQEKIMLHFRPGPSTPPLRGGQRFKMSSSLHFDAVVKFLRKRLQLQNHESVFCYVNQVFAPGLDEGVGNLWRCFKTGDELVVSYCVAQSFG
ncbi:ubiquitin-like protein [Aureobasidium pullulans]|uniref:Ubiquitin-like protein ATG12 n=1 Tax=Aureobasidium pullulans TaxID=5580 RepID=A0A4S8VYW8_AURPU|nr:ubiquitin-like protein [Aureobasidium pullulans]